MAGGTETRLGTDVPKQYLEVCGRPVISYCMEGFAAHEDIGRYASETDLVMVHDGARPFVSARLIAESLAPETFRFGRYREANRRLLPERNFKITTREDMERFCGIVGQQEKGAAHEGMGFARGGRYLF